MISIIIPMHNEEKTVNILINNLDLILKNLDYEIIAIDDNSNDKTHQILDIISKNNKHVNVIHNISEKKGPTGLGNAIKLGFANSKGDILIPFMGDMSDEPKDILKMIEKINEGYDVVCGSRFIKGGMINGYPKSKLIAHRIYNTFFSILFGLKLKDFSNAFKAYKRSVIETIKLYSDGFEMTAEMLLKAHIYGFKITEIPVSWKERNSGSSKFGSALKLPRLGYRYVKLALRLWIKFLISRLKKF